MTSRKSSILKPLRVREPLQDLNQLLPSNDEDETSTITSDNYKRRVSFANVNKVKEFEISAECTTLLHTPAYDEHFSVSSDSGQSSLSENSRDKSVHRSNIEMKTTKSSDIRNRSDTNDENVEVIEVEFFNVSRGAPSSCRTNVCDSNMGPRDVTELETETSYPLDLTKGHMASSTQCYDSDEDILESSSMETTEVLPCLIAETIRIDCEPEVEKQSPEIGEEELNLLYVVEDSVSLSHGMSKKSEIFLREKPAPKRLSAEMIDPEEHDVVIAKRRSLNSNSCNDENGLSQLQKNNQNIKSITIREEKSTFIDVDKDQRKAEITQITDINVDVAYEEIFPQNEDKNSYEEKCSTADENCDKTENIDSKIPNAEITVNQSQEEIILSIEDISENQPLIPCVLGVLQSPPKTDSLDKNDTRTTLLKNKSADEIVENISEPETVIKKELPLENNLKAEKVEIPVNTSTTLAEKNSLSRKLPTKIASTAPQTPVFNTSENTAIGNVSELIILDDSGSPKVIETSYAESQNTSSMIVECDFEDVMSNLKAVNLTGDLSMYTSQDENEPSLEIVKSTSAEIIQVSETTEEIESSVDVIESVKVETSECGNQGGNENINDLKMIHNASSIQEKIDIAKNIKKALKREMPYWCVKSITSNKWIFDALWNRLQLKILFNDNEDRCAATLNFVPKAPTIEDEVLRSKAVIGDNVLKIAARSILRKYKPKLDLFCTKAKDVLHLLQILSPDVIFAEKFAENFTHTLLLEDIKLSKGITTFYVSSYEKRLLVKIEVCLKDLENLSLSSIKVTQMIGNVDVNLVHDTFCKAGRDYDFFSKFVQGLWQQIDN